jgi:hypothetical protein
MDHVQTKNHNYQPHYEKKLDVFLSTCTFIKRNNKTPSIENPKAKNVTTKITRNVKSLNLKMK